VLAIGFATLHAAIAVAIAAVPLAYGSVGKEAMYDDVHIYFHYGSLILAGQVPYHDFRLEYPVLALPAFLLPRIVTNDFDAYRWLFALELYAANALTLFLVIRTVGRYGTHADVLRRLAWYSLVLALLCPLALCRFDLMATAWAFAAALAFSSARPGLGGVLAGTGVHLKIVPGVTALVGIASPGPGRPRGLVGFLATCAAGVGGTLWLGGRYVSSSLLYHVERGVEIGSTHAGLMMVAAWLFVAPLSYRYVEHANEVITPWSNAAARLAFPVQVAALLAVAWKARKAIPRGADPMRFHAAGVLGFMAFGKVLSPQYVLWPLPFLAVLKGPIGARARAAFLIVCILTTLIYPWELTALMDFTPLAVTMLNVRNFLLVGLWGFLTFSSHKCDDYTPREAGLPSLSAL
jgi:hypothetical protein